MLETCINVQALTSNVSFLQYNNVGDYSLVSMFRRSEKFPPSASMNLVRADVEVSGNKKYIDRMGKSASVV